MIDELAVRTKRCAGCDQTRSVLVEILGFEFCESCSNVFSQNRERIVVATRAAFITEFRMAFGPSPARVTKEG